LIYSTCTFEPEENIAQIIALQKKYNCQSIAIDLPTNNFDNQITIIQKENAIGYSFYPHKTAGEGFFCSVLQFTNQLDSPPKSKEKQANKNEIVSKNEIELLRKFAAIENNTIEKFGANYYALSDSVVSLFKKVNALNIKSVGVKLGEIKGKDVIPSQELSLSFLLNNNIPTIDLPLETALQFLKTEAINLEGEIGWNTVSYHGFKLGWVKVLQNRCNNYFPKEWKIRKEIDL
jgi:NOL1/NOP2/fmu family ribosome biogenesis protein